MVRRGVAIGALIIGVVMLAYSFIPGYGPQQTWFESSDAVLSDPDGSVTAVNWHPHGDPNSAGKPLQFKSSAEDHTISVDLVGLTAGWYTLELVHKGTGQNKDWSEYKELQVLGKQLGVIAAAGALLAILALPEVLVRKSRLVWRSGNRQICATGWLYLLMEPGTGLSLARLQLIILFVPAAAVYLALSFPLHQFPPMPDTVWQLLGLGGASAALSTIMSPAQNPTTGSQTPPDAPPADATAAGLDPAPAPAPQPAPPSNEDLAKAFIASLKQQNAAALDLSSEAGLAALTDAVRQAVTKPKAQTIAPAPALTDLITVRAPGAADLFEEATGFGDISRYQSLVMCIATAATFFVSFFDTWSVPDLPPKVLELLGTSLAVYLGVKGINQVKKSNAQKTAA